MGMYDDVRFEMDYPDPPFAGRLFQTKSLDCCLDHYTVTKVGRLCLRGNPVLPAEQQQADNVDVEFHGDIRLRSVDGQGEQYIARFTHGTLEWVRPMADMPESRLPVEASRKYGRRE